MDIQQYQAVSCASFRISVMVISFHASFWLQGAVLLRRYCPMGWSWPATKQHLKQSS
jgi:hypothetical protein